MTIKRMTKQDYDKLCDEMLGELVNDPSLKDKGITSFLIPMTQIIGMRKIGDKIFTSEDTIVEFEID